MDYYIHISVSFVLESEVCRAVIAGTLDYTLGVDGDPLADVDALSEPFLL